MRDWIIPNDWWCPDTTAQGLWFREKELNSTQKCKSPRMYWNYGPAGEYVNSKTNSWETGTGKGIYESDEAVLEGKYAANGPKNPGLGWSTQYLDFKKKEKTERNSLLQKTSLTAPTRNVTSSLKKKNWENRFKDYLLCTSRGVLWNFLAENYRESLSAKRLERNTLSLVERLKDSTQTNSAL